MLARLEYTPITGGTAPPTSTAVNQGYPSHVYPPSSGTHGQTFDGGQSHPKPACTASQPQQNPMDHNPISEIMDNMVVHLPRLMKLQEKVHRSIIPQASTGPPIPDTYPPQVAQQHQYFPPPNQGYDIPAGHRSQPQGHPSTHHEQGASRPHVPGQYPSHGAQQHHYSPPHDQDYGIPGGYQHQLQEYPPMHFEHGTPEAHIPGESPPHTAQQHHHPLPHDQAHGDYEQRYGGHPHTSTRSISRRTREREI